MNSRASEKETAKTSEVSYDPEQASKSNGPLSIVVDETIQPESNLSQRHSSALLELDRSHSWLSELDERSANMEASFLTKTQYVALSNRFQSFLEDLRSKQQVTPEIHGEFENLFEKFRTCYAGNLRLQNKVYELTSLKDIAELKNLELESKVEDMIKEIEDLHETLQAMRLDEAEIDKEKRALQQEINNLKEDLSHRSNKEQFESFDESSGSDAPFLEKETEEELKIHRLEDELRDLKEDFGNVSKRGEIYEEKILNMTKEIDELEKQLNIAKSDYQTNVVLLDKTQKQLKELQLLLEEEKEMNEEIREENNQLKKQIEEERSSYKRLYEDLAKSEKVLEEKSETLERLRRDFESRGDRIKLLITEKDSLSLELEGKQLEMKSLKLENGNILKQRREGSRKISKLEKNISDLEMKNENLQEKTASLQRELEAMKNELRDKDKKINELTKQKNNYLEELKKLDKLASSLRDDIQIREKRETLLSKDLGLANKTIGKLQGVIKTQEQEHERSNVRIFEQKKLIEEQKHEMDRLNIAVSNSEKLENQLKEAVEKKEELYKNQVEDTRFYHKTLLEAKSKIEQLNSKLNMLDKYTLQLKGYNETLNNKREFLIQEKQNVEEQLGVVKESLKRAQKNGAELETGIKQKEKENQQLLQQIAVLERDKKEQEKALENVRKEKDALGLKLQKKEEAVHEEKEKVKLLEIDLTKLEVALNDRMEDIKLLKLQLSEMNRSKTLMEDRVEKMEEACQELATTEKELQEQKLKVKKLEEAFQNPMNLHRWRNLEGTDPEKSQLVTKCLEFQHQLLKKTTELEDKDSEIQEMKEELKKAREMLERRFESGVDHQLWECKSELKAGRNRLKCLSAENAMYESTLKKYGNEITLLKDELRKYKLDEFNTKKKS